MSEAKTEANNNFKYLKSIRIIIKNLIDENEELSKKYEKLR